MTETTFSFSEDTNQNILLLRLKGKINSLTSAELDTELTRKIQNGHVNLILDFAHIDFVSSLGLRVLLVAQNRVSHKNGNIHLLNVQDKIKEIFDIAGFSKLFGFSNDEAEAVKKLTP